MSLQHSEQTETVPHRLLVEGGAVLMASTSKGEEPVFLHAGTQHGETFLLPGKGPGNPPGDHWVTVLSDAPEQPIPERPDWLGFLSVDPVPQGFWEPMPESVQSRQLHAQGHVRGFYEGTSAETRATLILELQRRAQRLSTSFFLCGLGRGYLGKLEARTVPPALQEVLAAADPDRDMPPNALSAPYDYAPDELPDVGRRLIERQVEPVVIEDTERLWAEGLHLRARLVSPEAFHDEMEFRVFCEFQEGTEPDGMPERLARFRSAVHEGPWMLPLLMDLFDQVPWWPKELAASRTWVASQPENANGMVPLDGLRLTTVCPRGFVLVQIDDTRPLPPMGDLPSWSDPMDGGPVARDGASALGHGAESGSATALRVAPLRHGAVTDACDTRGLSLYALLYPTDAFEGLEALDAWARANGSVLQWLGAWGAHPAVLEYFSPADGRASALPMRSDTLLDEVVAWLEPGPLDWLTHLICDATRSDLPEVTAERGVQEGTLVAHTNAGWLVLAAVLDDFEPLDLRPPDGV